MSKRDLVSKLNKSRSNVIKWRVTIMIVRLTQACTFLVLKIESNKEKKRFEKRYSKRYTFSSIKQLILIIIHTLYICCTYVVYMKKFIFILFLIDHFRFYDVNSNRVETESTKMHSFVNMVLCFVYTTRIYKQSCAFMLGR